MTLERYVRKDGKTVWRFKFFVRKQRYQGTLGPIPLAEAKRHERRIRAEVEAGIYQPKRPTAPPVPTVEAVADRFIQWYRAGHRSASTNRHESGLIWHLLPPIHNRPITMLTTAYIDGYIAERSREGASPRTLNAELSTLSLLIKKAIEWGHLSPANKPTISWLPTEKKETRVLMPAEESAMLVASPARLRPLLVFALHTGLRKGELIGLMWADVDLVNRVVTVVSVRSKNRLRRRVPLNDTALDVLRMLSLNGRERVFGYRSVNKSVARAAARAHLKGVSCHTLRHTFATRCAERGVPPTVLQKWLGHQRLDVTQGYVHHLEEFEHDIIRVLDAPPSQHNTFRA